MIGFWQRVTASIPSTRSKAWLCRQIGVDSGTLLSWIKHDRLPRADVAVTIAMTLGQTAEYLLTGEHPAPQALVDTDLGATVTVPLLTQTHIAEFPMVGERIIVPKLLVRDCEESSLGAVQVRGDSMIDEQLIHGDVAIFSDRGAQGEGLYVLDIHGDILIRRIQCNPVERTMTLFSANPRYEGKRVVPLDHENVRILGKVVAWFHRNV